MPSGLKTSRFAASGIVGMGESRKDREELLHTLATLAEHPQSVPINQLVQVEGTPLNGIDALDPLEFVRTIAVARILMPRSYVRLSAGRTDMSDEMQALCFFAGANSIFYGDELLTTPNPDQDRDLALLQRLGMQVEAADSPNTGLRQEGGYGSPWSRSQSGDGGISRGCSGF